MQHMSLSPRPSQQVSSIPRGGLAERLEDSDHLGRSVSNHGPDVPSFPSHSTTSFRSPVRLPHPHVISRLKGSHASQSHTSDLGFVFSRSTSLSVLPG